MEPENQEPCQHDYKLTDNTIVWEKQDDGTHNARCTVCGGVWYRQEPPKTQ